MPELKTDIRYIKGIGEQCAKSLAKLDIFTLQDLVSYFIAFFNLTYQTILIPYKCLQNQFCLPQL